MNTPKNFFSFFFGFKGKISQKHYTIFLIVFILFSIVWLPIISFIGEFALLATNIGSADAIPLWFFAISALLLWIVLKFSHVVRRVHDLNMKATSSMLFQAILWVEVIYGILPFTGMSDLYIVNYIPWIGLICMIGLAFIPSKSTSEHGAN